MIPDLSLPREVGPWATIAVLLGSVSFGAETPRWTMPECSYRVAVDFSADDRLRMRCPAGVEIDFAALFKEAGLPGRLDRHSIRVVVTGAGTELPFQLTGDFANTSAGRVWWRVADEKAAHYHLYFDSLEHGAKPPPTRTGLVGVGDPFRYGNGEPGPAPVHPLHSVYWHLDWDGDGLRDLIGFAYQRYEHGMPLQKNMGNGIWFLKNIGTAKEPLFAPRQRLKGEDGQYLQTDLLPQNMYPVDWNKDGRMDFIGSDSRKNLLLWENTGQRDKNGLFVLRPARSLVKLDAVSDFRAGAPGVVRKPTFIIRAITPVDWNGDGGRDLVLAWANTNILAKVDSKRGVIPYGAPLQVFELLEDISTDPVNAPAYAPPRVIMEERGLPITAACYANGGVSYMDWDGDGDHDLLFQDATNRPLDGGRLMFSENAGTRQAPVLLMPVPVRHIKDSPQFVDWNDDGLIDMVAGGEFFENTNPLSGGRVRVSATTGGGTRLPKARYHPQMVPRGPAKQIDPEILGHWAASADWNGDGNLDIVRGVVRHVQVFVNRGTTLNPVFDFGVNLQAGGCDIDMPNWLQLDTDLPVDRGPQGMGEAEHSWLNPTPVDFDRDGDLDLFVTSQRWQTMYFENTGTRSQPVLAKGREVRFQGDAQEFSWRSKLSAGDLDNDGNMEIVVTSDDDNIFYVYRPAAQQTDAAAFEFNTREPLRLEDGQPMTGWHGGQNNNGDNHSLLVDWDGDSDLDLINGTLWHIFYYENTGTRQKPVFKPHGKLKAGGEELLVFRHAGSVDAADWNGDGRLDLMVSTENPSDQPLGEIIHLFDRSYLDGELPMATRGAVETRPDTVKSGTPK